MSFEIIRERPAASANLLVHNKGPGAVPIPTAAGVDVMEIYFDRAQMEAELETSDARTVVFDDDKQVRKLGVVGRVLEAQPSLLLAYERIQIVDDDVTPVGPDIGAAFRLFENIASETGARIAQPALTSDSYHCHRVVIREPRYVWRRVTFVEVMIPFFTRAAFVEYAKHFAESVMCWGFDTLWSNREMDAGRPLAILDETPWRHSRPLYVSEAYANLVTPAHVEGDQFMAKHKTSPRPEFTLGGVDAAGNWSPLLICQPPPQSMLAPHDAQASARYTWTGREERLICAQHERLVRSIGDSIGISPNLQKIEGLALEGATDPRRLSPEKWLLRMTG